MKKYADVKRAHLKLVDIDENALEIIKSLYKDKIPNNFNTEYINDDFISLSLEADLRISNPPFSTITKKILQNIAGNTVIIYQI